MDEDHIKTALWLPAVDTQRVLAATVQAAAIGIEEDAPGPGERRPWVRSLRRGCGKPRTRAEVETRKGHRGHAPWPGGGPAQRPAAAYLTGPGSPSIQLTTWNFSRSQKRMVLQRVRPQSWFLRRPVAGKTRFFADTCPPTPRSGLLLSTWEVDTGLGSRQARKAQDTGAGELESGERCDLGARLAWLAVSSVQIGYDTPGPRSRLGQIHTQSTEVWQSQVTGPVPPPHLSELPEARRYSLGWNSTTLTGPVWPGNSDIILPAVRSQSWGRVGWRSGPAWPSDSG